MDQSHHNEEHPPTPPDPQSVFIMWTQPPEVGHFDDYFPF